MNLTDKEDRQQTKQVNYIVYQMVICTMEGNKSRKGDKE